MQNRKNGWSKLATVAAAAVLVIAALAYIGWNAGARHGDATKDRLDLVWPDVLSMPELDRGLLVGLAMTCQLHQRPMERDQVVECLRAGAADPNAIVPVGFDRTMASSRLEQLLKQKDKITMTPPTIQIDSTAVTALDALSEVLVQIRGIASDAAARGHCSALGGGRFNPEQACAAIFALADATHNLPAGVRSGPEGGAAFLLESELAKLSEVGAGVFGDRSPFKAFGQQRLAETKTTAAAA